MGIGEVIDNLKSKFVKRKSQDPLHQEIKEKKKLLTHLKDKFRLVLYNDTSFAEVWQIRLSRLNVFTFGGFFFIFIVALIFMLLVYSPLKVFLPAYHDSDMQRKILINAFRLDSLKKEIDNRDKYLQNVKLIIEGKTPQENINQSDTSTRYKNIKFEKSAEDSLLRKQIEQEEQYNLSVTDDQLANKGISNMHFFAPVNKGWITNEFNFEEGHFAIDVVGETNSGIMATLDGTVIMATWTLETGHVIEIQHENNLISIYKHNSALLKEVGSHVKAGETIAIIGNSGELSTGPHLHFELWYNGTPVNPQDYIVF